ncbi:dihydrofolate reductase family protein [Pseudarthrobacter sp. NamB4]|uniref:dihydrofolate reductase family protein n=1 Tax=Pseudarthrobacter sp. NamB4 TaxID=2576837 RepID=UPI0010FF2F5C|nr:dihydrofolate reductase family protein [Pseudarthrobacter sp. NamB4]TLM72797.1 dihydrofolate reductase [Pseudarthrobacter sp. NamB4]
MRKIILQNAVSLDGFFEGPGRDISWHRVDEELHQHMNDELSAMGGFIAGRVTHELMAEYWPAADRNPESSPAEAVFARIWRGMPKYVFSRTLTEAPWNTTVIADVVPEHIGELKAQAGGDLVMSGADLAGTFMRHGLIDEFRIYVQPVVIGQGPRVFQSPDFTADLHLVENRSFGNGVVLLRYEALNVPSAASA